MKAQDIRTKLEKAQEVVAKKEKTLDKYYAKADKIRKQIAAKGWDVNGDRYQKMDTEEHQDFWKNVCYILGRQAELEKEEQREHARPAPEQPPRKRRREMSL